MNISIVRALIICLSALFCGGAFADGAQLIKSRITRDKEEATLTVKERDSLDRVRKGHGVRSVSVVSIDRNAFLSTVISITSPSGKVGKFTVNKTSVRENLHSWTFSGPGPMDSAIFVLSDEGDISGQVDMGRERFTIESINATVHVMVDVDAGAPQEEFKK
jgi:hypothetical protein